MMVCGARLLWVRCDVQKGHWEQHRRTWRLARYGLQLRWT